MPSDKKRQDARKRDVWTRMESKVLACDQFGEPISLNYSGETEYRSMCGGCCSIVMVLIVLQFAIFKFHYVNNDIQWRFFKVKAKAPAGPDTSPIRLTSQYNLSFGIEFEHPYAGLPLSANEYQNETENEKKRLSGQYVDHIQNYVYVERHHSKAVGWQTHSEVVNSTARFEDNSVEKKEMQFDLTNLKLGGSRENVGNASHQSSRFHLMLNYSYLYEQAELKCRQESWC